MTRIVIFLGILVVSSVSWAGPPAVPTRPNILFIMTDQHRFDCLGANGNAIVRTPNLDRLAARSANFQNAFVQAPVCVPSRITWFTGRYPHSHRNRVNYTPLKPDELLLPRLLQRAGYTTASVGKLHLYPPTATAAMRAGFQRVWLHDGVSRRDAFSDYVRWRKVNDPASHIPYRSYARHVPAGKNPFRAAIADAYTDTTWTGHQAEETLRVLAKSKRPFFLFVSFWKPHSPYEVPVPFDSMYDDVTIPLPKKMTHAAIEQLPPPLQKQILRGRPQYAMDRQRLQWIYRSYYAAISHVDREVGRVLDALRKSNCQQDTIVVFASDHGDQLLEHGLMEKNVLFEASVRIPFLFCYPGRVRPGKQEALIETTDLVPTLCDLAGIDQPRSCQGRSFLPLIAGDGGSYEGRSAVFCENIIPEVITTGSLDYSYQKNRGIAGIRHPDAKMIRTARWKLNYYPTGYGELYDLKNDPLEEHNLYLDPAHGETVASLKERLLQWLITADEADQIADKWLE